MGVGASGAVEVSIAVHYSRGQRSIRELASSGQTSSSVSGLCSAEPHEFILALCGCIIYWILMVMPENTEERENSFTVGRAFKG